MMTIDRPPTGATGNNKRLNLRVSVIGHLESLTVSAQGSLSSLCVASHVSSLARITSVSDTNRGVHDGLNYTKLLVPKQPQNSAVGIKLGLNS